MKHICVDARLLGHSGIGRYLSSLLPHLLQAPYRWTVLTSTSQPIDVPFLKNVEVKKLPHAVFSKRELLFLHREIPECDLFWAPHFNGPLLRPKAKQMVLTLHDTFHLRFFHSLKVSEKIYMRFLFPHILRRFHGIITVSSFSKSEITTQTQFKNDIQVIHNGIDFSTKKRGTASFQDDAPYFLFVGAHKPHKNLPFLLTAFAQSKAFHSAHIKICGQSKGMRTHVSIEGLVRELGLEDRVELLGAVSDEHLVHLYEKALAFVFPSLYEGFGLPPLEAMSYGCPVIVSNVASLPEVCEGAAHYIDPTNEASLATALITLATDSTYRSELIRKGSKHAAQYTWEKSAEKHCTFFESLLRGKP